MSNKADIILQDEGIILEGQVNAEEVNIEKLTILSDGDIILHPVPELGPAFVPPQSNPNSPSTIPWGTYMPSDNHPLRGLRALKPTSLVNFIKTTRKEIEDLKAEIESLKNSVASN